MYRMVLPVPLSFTRAYDQLNSHTTNMDRNSDNAKAEENQNKKEKKTMNTKEWWMYVVCMYCIGLGSDSGLDSICIVYMCYLCCCWFNIHTCIVRIHLISFSFLSRIDASDRSQSSHLMYLWYLAVGYVCAHLDMRAKQVIKRMVKRRCIHERDGQKRKNPLINVYIPIRMQSAIRYTRNTTAIHLWIRNKLFVLFNTTSIWWCVCVFMFAFVALNGSIFGAMHTKLAFDYLCAQFAFILTTWIRLQFILQQMRPNHRMNKQAGQKKTDAKLQFPVFLYRRSIVVSHSWSFASNECRQNGECAIVKSAYANIIIKN